VSASNRIIASPLARHLAQKAGLDLALLTGTGPKGRIIKRDIEAALANPSALSKAPAAASATPAAPAAAGTNIANSAIMPPLADARAYYNKDNYDEIPMDGMRGAIATRLTQSMQQIPHFYLTRALPMDAMMAYRASINEALSAQGEKISLNDLLVRACALSLMDVPEVNVSFAGDAILQHHHADIGVAVALPDGLITPIVANCDEKPIRAIAAQIKDMAARAAEKRLKPQEYEGGSFSVSNLGMFGIDQFTAVINPPQAAILAVGGLSQEWKKINDEMVESHIMRVTLSCDHRAIDGAVGARFLSVLADYFENPLLLAL
jgi:pyruvate dehydrogenase E2 component (dihydrolipoamide acetyltransferase)